MTSPIICDTCGKKMGQAEIQIKPDGTLYVSAEDLKYFREAHAPSCSNPSKEEKKDERKLFGWRPLPFA